MKIKDALAGKKGKCPKCKTGFVVPQPESEDEEELVDEPVPDDAEEDDEEWEDEDDDDDLLDMPMELTSAPTVEPPPAEMPAAASRDRKSASETKKATRIAPKKKKKSDGFDPTDVLFEDEPAGGGGGATTAAASAPGRSRPVGGRVIDDEELDGPAVGSESGSMASMFKDFTPAGGRKKEAPAEKSTNVAADLLARKAEEKRNQNNNPYDTTVEEDDEDSTVSQIIQLAKDNMLYVGLGIIGIVGLFMVSNAMMGGSDRDIPDLIRVYGSVKRRGEPVPMAQLIFEPQMQRVTTEVNTAGGATAFTDDAGEYDVEYSKGYYGLPAGKYKIQIMENGRKVAEHEFVLKDSDDSNLPFELSSN